MSDLLKQRLAENQTHPYAAQHELVFEILELEKELVELNKKVTDLQNAISVLLSSEKPVAPAAALAPETPVEATDSTEKE